MISVGFIPPSDLQIALGRVVGYETRLPTELYDGRIVARGAPCLALRHRSGELCLIFLAKNPYGDAGTCVWLHRDTGLVGVEPNVVDPMLLSLAHLEPKVVALVADTLARYRGEDEPVVGALLGDEIAYAGDQDDSEDEAEEDLDEPGEVLGSEVLDGDPEGDGDDSEDPGGHF